MAKGYINIRVEGYSEEIRKFVHLCKCIQGLGKTGSSGDILISVDGDGSGTLNFSLFNESETMELESINISEKPQPYKIDIGE